VRRIYYGWYVVAMSALVFMLLIGSTFSAFGLFVVPVSKELGLSRAEMNSSIILLNIGNALVAPFVGRMLDRFPVRRIMIGAALILCAGLVTLGLSRSLWLSAFMMAVPLAIGLQGAGTLTMTVLIARWFQAQRGRAMALAVIGMSLGGVLVTPLVGLLIEAQGWRLTLIISGCVISAMLLLLSLIVRDRPGPADAEGGKPAKTAEAPRPVAPGAPAKMGELLRAPQFWTIALGSSLAFAVSQGVLVSLAPLALDSGLTIVQATTLISASGVGAMAGKLLLAIVADRVDRVALYTVLLAMIAIVNAALLVNQTYVALLGCSVILGLLSGVLTPIFFALLADRFGSASFGTVRGLMAPIGAVMGAVAVRFAGEVYDRTGGYDVMFSTFIGVQLLAAALMFSTRFFGRPPGEGLSD